MESATELGVVQRGENSKLSGRGGGNRTVDSDKQVRAEPWLQSEGIRHSLPKDPRSHSSTAIFERLEVIQLQNREQGDRGFAVVILRINLLQLFRWSSVAGL